MQDSHLHKCGYDPECPDESGCGLVWGHPDSTAELPRGEILEAHMCPRCGKGPWTGKFNPDEEELEIFIIEVLE